MKKKKWMSTTALCLTGVMTLQSVNWQMLDLYAADADNTDKALAYFVDCGDFDPSTLATGDKFGVYNSVTEQVYGKDPETGKTWGIADTVSSPLKNGTAAVAPKAAYTDDTWPYEFFSTADGEKAGKTDTNRYTKNQSENGIDRHLDYSFEVPNGTYTVEVGFADPWGVSGSPSVKVEGKTPDAFNKIIALAGDSVKAAVTVSDGKLDMNVTSDSACINMTFIKIYFGDVTSAGDTTEKVWDSSYGTYSMYDLDQVDITDAYLTNAEDKDIEYLLSLDSDKLLAGFRETAGLDMKGATRYSGWENTLIGSHTMGHYLTAMAQAVATLPDTDARKAKVEEKLEYIITSLSECQDKLGTGYIFGATLPNKNNVELQFDNVEANRTNIGTQAWVPWYTMHKILAGVVDTYKYTGNTTALKVAKNLGTWVYNRTSKWSSSTQAIVLGIEYGGMNDCLYELYAVTGDEKYAVAAHKFDEESLFAKVDTGKANVLDGLHANTTIPKFLGALNGYITTHGKTIDGVDTSKYLTYAEEFFDMVLERHTYVTGDNSEWEHFGKDHVLDAERTNCNCETCNAYNMLKLAKALYMVTGDAKYLNYYEEAFYNTILSSQNPETGMGTYFQPMATGYFKVYSTPTTKFWCCTGSGMENFTKLGNAVYFYNDDQIVVNQYFSSVLTDSEKNIKITQKANIPSDDTITLTVNTLDNSASLANKVAFRIPDWTDSESVKVTVNGAVASYETKDGLGVLSGLKNGDVIKLTFPLSLSAVNLPDGENTYAFKYGPIVLSAKLGTDKMEEDVTGVQVTIPKEAIISEDYVSSGTDTISVIKGTVEEFMVNLDENLVKTDGKLEWTLQNTDANLTFVPHYSQYKERYGIYFTYESNSGAFNSAKYVKDKAAARFAEAKIDTVQPGYGQYENDALHDMIEEGNGSEGSTSDGTTRYAKAGGSFTYTMAVDSDAENVLEATFRKADNGKTIKISADGTVIYNKTLDYSGSEEEYTVRIPIPESVTKVAATKTVDDKEYNVVKIKVESADSKDSARICEFLYTTRAYDTDTSLELSSVKGNVQKSKDGKTFDVQTGDDVTTLDLTAELSSKYGYIKVNGNTVKTENPYEVDLSKNNFVTLTYTVYAEDHETTAEYTVNILKDHDLSDRTDTDSKLAYFVNCGDYDVTTLSGGDAFGIYNGVTDQVYGADPVTGKKWGIVDTLSDPLVNGTASNAAMTNAVFTDWTWTFETDAAVTDESSKTATNRYTKNQYEKNVARHLDYKFELPNGTYTVAMYFADPWNCSKNPIVKANGTAIITNGAVNKELTGTVDVTDGVLALNVTAPTATLALNLCYIKIYNPTTVKSEFKDASLVGDTLNEVLTGVKAGTTVEELAKCSDYQVKVFKAGSEAAAGQPVATGDLVQLLNSKGNVISEYVACVKGDVTGDGKIDVQDMEAIQKDVLNIKNVYGQNKQAGIFDDSRSDLNVTDMEVIQKHILALEKIEG